MQSDAQCDLLIGRRVVAVQRIQWLTNLTSNLITTSTRHTLACMLNIKDSSTVIKSGPAQVTIMHHYTPGDDDSTVFWCSVTGTYQMLYADQSSPCWPI
jgi:hypothetical protein